MILKETPYIKIRNRNGLKYIDYTACDIIGLRPESNQAAARSYNTIIGVYTRDSTGRKYYFQTSGSYSTTTATKHKPRAAGIAAYNNYIIVDDVHPKILNDLYFYNKYNVDEIIQEAKIRTEIINTIRSNPDTSIFFKNKKCYDYITFNNRTGKDYQNGNRQEVTIYKTNFKYLYNFQIKETRHAFQHKLKQYAGRTGTKGPATYTTYKYRSVIIY